MVNIMDPQLEAIIKLGNIRVILQMLNTNIEDLLPVLDEEYTSGSLPPESIKTSLVLYNRLKLLNLYIIDGMNTYLEDQRQLLEEFNDGCRQTERELRSPDEMPELR